MAPEYHADFKLENMSVAWAAILQCVVREDLAFSETQEI